MLLAQSALETGNWQAMWCWNFGNSTVSSTNTTLKWFALKDTPGYRYRAFGSATEGASYYVNMLKRTFTQAWSLLGGGDTAAFAQALKAQHYFTADVDEYAQGLASKYSVAT